MSLSQIIEQCQLHEKFLDAELTATISINYIVWLKENGKTHSKDSFKEYLNQFTKEDAETIIETMAKDA